MRTIFQFILPFLAIIYLAGAALTPVQAATPSADEPKTEEHTDAEKAHGQLEFVVAKPGDKLSVLFPDNWRDVARREPCIFNPDIIEIGDHIAYNPDAPVIKDKYKAYTQCIEVQKDDTLSKLAFSHCGRLLAYRDIHSANPSIQDPDVIEIGDRIWIPCMSETSRSGWYNSHLIHMRHRNDLDKYLDQLKAKLEATVNAKVTLPGREAITKEAPATAKKGDLSRGQIRVLNDPLLLGLTLNFFNGGAGIDKAHKQVLVPSADSFRVSRKLGQQVDELNSLLEPENKGGL